MEHERGSNPCAQESSNEKKKVLTFESGMGGGKLKLFFKIKDSSHIGNCAFKCRGKSLFILF